MSERVKGQSTELDKEVNKLTKKDRTEYVEDLVSETEEAARRQDLRTSYKITLYGNFRSLIRDKEDNIITDDSKEVLCLGVESFSINPQQTFPIRRS